jgi:hypothetical protein
MGVLDGLCFQAMFQNEQQLKFDVIPTAAESMAKEQQPCTIARANRNDNDVLDLLRADIAWVKLLNSRRIHQH